jgi:hypothetical protein
MKGLLCGLRMFDWFTVKIQDVSKISIAGMETKDRTGLHGADIYSNIQGSGRECTGRILVKRWSSWYK